jgi:hypothetical protein
MHDFPGNDPREVKRLQDLRVKKIISCEIFEYFPRSVRLFPAKMIHEESLQELRVGDVGVCEVGVWDVEE